MIDFKGAAEPRSDASAAVAASILGCDRCAIEAVMAVEAANSGFDYEGRPKALFEPHIFYAKLTEAKKPTLLREAETLGLAYRKWGTKPYPADSYPRILAACEIDEELALHSTSWGLPQILGVHHGVCGYESAKEMVSAFAATEDAQVEAMARFIKANPKMLEALRRLDWVAFKCLYNGPGANSYADRLKSAYVRAVGHGMALPPPATPASLNRKVANQHKVEAAGSASAGLIVLGSVPAVAMASNGNILSFVATAVLLGLGIFFGWQAFRHVKQAVRSDANPYESTVKGN